jgi:O-antigen/teichoic acid export membrane protein
LNSDIKALLKGSAILAISNISLRALSFFLLPLYTTHLTPAQIGVSDAIANFASLLFSLLVLALDAAYSAFYYDQDTEEHRRKIFSTAWLTLAAGALLCWLAMLASPLVSNILFGSSEYQWVICIAFFGVSMQLVALPYALDLRIQNKMLLYSVVTVAGAALAVGMNILFVVVLDLGVYAFILSSALTALSQFVAYRVIRKKGAVLRAFDFGLLKRMLRFSLPLIPASLSFWVMNAFGLYMILLFHSESEVGIYGIATRFSTALTTITNAIQVSYTAYAFQTIRKEGAPERIKRVVSAYFLVIVSICFAVCTIGREVVALMTTDAYTSAYLFLPGVMFGLLAYSLFSFFNYGVAFVKKSHITTVSASVGALVSMVFCSILVPLWGGFGASVALLLCYLATASLQCYFSERINPMGYPVARIAILFFFLLGLSFAGLLLPLGVRLFLFVCGMATLLFVFRGSLSEIVSLAESVLRRQPKRPDVSKNE